MRTLLSILPILAIGCGGAAVDDSAGSPDDGMEDDELVSSLKDESLTCSPATSSKYHDPMVTEFGEGPMLVAKLPKTSRKGFILAIKGNQGTLTLNGQNPFKVAGKPGVAQLRPKYRPRSDRFKTFVQLTFATGYATTWQRPGDAEPFDGWKIELLYSPTTNVNAKPDFAKDAPNFYFRYTSPDGGPRFDPYVCTKS